MIIDVLPRRESNAAKKIEEVSGQNLSLCYQCGLCAGGCPAGFAMDLLPQQVLHLAQLGMWERIKGSKTAWLCASCFACTVGCPRGVDIAKLMEAVRHITLRKNINYVEPSKIAAETLAELPQVALVSSFRKHTA
jgi:heterodisulfide reductase subunit C